MVFRGIVWIRIALAGGLAPSMQLTASAQAPRRNTEPHTPAKDAKDLKSVFFNWMRNMDMLKGHDERGMVATLEYQGTGTIQVEGQPCARSTGQAYSNIERWWSRGSCRHESCGAMRIPTRDC